MGFPGGSVIKNPHIMHEPQEMCVHSLGQEHPLGESMTTYSRILAWKNPMDREAWEAIVHNIAKSQTQLK